MLELLAEKGQGKRVAIDALIQLVDLHHAAVGSITFKYFQHFPGAQHGNFIWLEEERTSPHEEPFNDALIFINSEFRQDRPMRRLIAAKELMHVFDGPNQRTATPQDFRKLINEIEAKPVSDDISAQYDADRMALWKATIALVPPWLRAEYLPAWNSGDVQAPELAARWWLPEVTVSSAMGSYYEKMCERFGVNIELKPQPPEPPAA